MVGTDRRRRRKAQFSDVELSGKPAPAGRQPPRVVRSARGAEGEGRCGIPATGSSACGPTRRGRQDATRAGRQGRGQPRRARPDQPALSLCGACKGVAARRHRAQRSYPQRSGRFRPDAAHTARHAGRCPAERHRPGRPRRLGQRHPRPARRLRGPAGRAAPGEYCDDSPDDPPDATLQHADDSSRRPEPRQYTATAASPAGRAARRRSRRSPTHTAKSGTSSGRSRDAA